jgi:hypothetical protein
MFLLLSSVFELQASIFKNYYHNNMPGLHLYTFIEFAAFTFIYHANFKNNNSISRIILINSVIFVLLSLLDAFVINGIWKPNNISHTYSSVSFVLVSLVFFHDSFKNDTEYYSWESPMFWFNTAILIYFSLNLFYFMLNNYLIDHAYTIAYNSMRIHAAINIISNCLLAKSFVCFRKLIKKY